MKKTIARLREVFHVAENEQALRNEAATKIGGALRKALMQRRYYRFMAAMRTWRKRQAAETLDAFQGRWRGRRGSRRR